ncbi:hypothetical protein [Methanooceanicella nereidis]|nr:hypothetical protein [Methanocella sp. CWC-04]
MSDEYPESLQEAIEMAKNKLSKMLGAPQNTLAVISSEEITWPDTSLGMPEPGKSYAQMLVEGYRIVLSFGDKKYEFHIGNGMVKMD